jgi:hypothetical protein
MSRQLPPRLGDAPARSLDEIRLLEQGPPHRVVHRHGRYRRRPSRSLPIINVGQNVISAAQDARAEADHETLTALHQMSRQQIRIFEGQNEILDLLKRKVADAG